MLRLTHIKHTFSTLPHTQEKYLAEEGGEEEDRGGEDEYALQQSIRTRTQELMDANKQLKVLLLFTTFVMNPPKFLISN